MSPAMALIPKNVKLSKSGDFLQGKGTAEINVEVEQAPDVARAIAGNSEFPSDGVIDLRGRVGSATGDVKFGDPGAGGTVTFGASAGGGVVVTRTAKELVKALRDGGAIGAALELPETGVARYALLEWGYDIGGAAKGSVALGVGGSLQFGVEGKTSGDFVVVRAFEAEPKAKDALDSLVGAWRLPRQISSPLELEPGTWIATEVDGEFAANVGAKFGYDYSWVRKVTGTALSGDIGLRIQAAAAITVGMSAAGKFLVVVARESLRPESRVLRVRVSKMARKGWSFAADASAKITPSTGKLLPKQLDDFVAAIFGVHGPQLVKDLQTFREWVDPNKPLPEKLGGFVAAYATRRLGSAAGPALEEARGRIASVLKAWEELPARVSGLLWDRLGDADRAEMEGWLRELAKGRNEKIREEIQKALGSVAFFSTPSGEWLSGVLEGAALDALQRTAALATVREAAKKTLAVLEGGVLEELAAFAKEKVGLAAIQKAVALADPKQLEPWLAAKLSEFVGKAIDGKGIEQVRKTLDLFLGKGEELYKAALEALNRQWAFSFQYAYSRATTKTALFDAEFDFAVNPALETAVRAAIQGDWTSLLLRPQDGVTLRTAELTHGIRRTSFVEITLPYFHGRVEQMTESLAKMSVQAEGTRLLLYEVNAKDEIVARNRWQSAFAVSGKFLAGVEGIRDFSSATADEEFRVGYTFRMGARAMRTAQLERRIEPLVADLFPTAFRETPLHEWVIDLDKLADEAEARANGTPNGSGEIGDVLLGLEVAAPGRALAAWRKAPDAGATAAEKAVYTELSKQIQRTLRRMLPVCYFASPKQYVGQEMKIAAPLLVYSCLPLSTKASVRNGMLAFDTGKDPAKDFYWDTTDAKLLLAMVNHPGTTARLGAAMGKIHGMLVDARSKFAEDYNPNHEASVRRIMDLAVQSKLLAGSLLFAERESIQTAIESALEMAKFTRGAGGDAEEALEALANFGEKLTRTFHSRLSTLFGGETIRQLGSVVFLEASQAFDAEVAAAKPVARLVVTLLRSSAGDDVIADFVKGTEPKPLSIAMQQPIVEV
jgi:hypothetical protein